MKQTFSQWFLGKGWKSYSIPYFLLIAITIAVSKSIYDIFASPVLVWIGIYIAYFGFAFGITYHMVMAYKNSEK